VACSTHDHVLFFTSNGRVFSEKVYQIPSGARTGRGKPIVNLLPLEVGEKLASVLTVDAFTEGHFLFFATTGGTVKKTDLMAYSNIRSSGIIAINLREGDRLMGVRLTNGNSNVLLATKSGMSIRFEEADVRPLGRDTSGVKGIDLNEDDKDEVVGCITFDTAQIDEKQACLLTVTATGYGKRTLLEEYRLQGRGGKGTIDIKAGGRNGDVVGCILVEHDYDHYILITDGGIILRAEASDVRLVGRNTMGVRMIAVEEGEKVVSIARYSDEDETTEGDADAAAEGEAGDPAGEGAGGSEPGDDET
jgi:DNA gyrase subunit A